MTHWKHGWNQQGGMCGRKKEKQKRSLKPEGGRRARSSTSDSGGRRKSGADQRGSWRRKLPVLVDSWGSVCAAGRSLPCQLHLPFGEDHIRQSGTALAVHSGAVPSECRDQATKEDD